MRRLAVSVAVAAAVISGGLAFSSHGSHRAQASPDTHIYRWTTTKMENMVLISLEKEMPGYGKLPECRGVSKRVHGRYANFVCGYEFYNGDLVAFWTHVYSEFNWRITRLRCRDAYGVRQSCPGGTP